MSWDGDDNDTEAFSRLLSRDVAALVRSARQLSGYVREDVLRGDVDAAMQALGLLDVRLAGLVRCVAEFLRYQRAGHRQPRIEWFSLRRVVTAEFRRIGPPSSATLAVNAATGRGQGDRALASDALHEVLHNALVHHPEPGRLDVVVDVAEANEGRMELSVYDNGVGIPAAAADRVFEPYVKLSAAEGSGRYGLGLAWCRRALEAVGGYIAVRNANRGACIVIGLPIGAATHDDIDEDVVDAESPAPRLRLV